MGTRVSPVTVPINGPADPAHREPPIGFHRPWEDTEQLSGLVDRQTDKEAKVNNLNPALVLRIKRSQGFIYHLEILDTELLCRRYIDRVYVLALPIPAVLDPALPPRAIDDAGRFGLADSV